ncbi:MAG: iron-containing alcohol dehydrogenase [Spirochaetaceae bacterium]|nr:iron-containing alcohol dehydrogenase [Spirochaetaceae bacterium]
MTNFNYYTPTRVVFGNNTEKETGALIKNIGGTNVLIHYGSERIVKSGLLKKIEDSLDKQNIKYTELGGVTSNPKLDLVRKGIDIVKKNKIDFILSIGGGSPLDSAKAIALGALSDRDVWDYYIGIAKTPDNLLALPTAVILTNAAAGSEMSKSSVVTDTESGLKRSTAGEFNQCKFAILNPELSITLPPFQSASGGFDAAMHSIERYFTPGKKSSLTKAIASSIIKEIFTDIKLVLKNPNDIDARGNIMWASSLSHNGLTELGNESRGDWACHKIEHELGGMFDCAHGAGIASIWCAWAQYCAKEQPKTIAEFGHDIFNFPLSDNVEKLAIETIEKMRSYLKEINMPTSIKELLGFTLSDEQIEELATKGTNNGTITLGAYKVLDKQDIVNIFRVANH